MSAFSRPSGRRVARPPQSIMLRCSVAVQHTLERSSRTLNSRLFGTGGIFGEDYGTPPYSVRADLLLLARRIDGTATHTDILTDDSIDDMKTPGSPNYSEGLRLSDLRPGLVHRQHQQSNIRGSQREHGRDQSRFRRPRERHFLRVDGERGDGCARRLSEA